MPSGGAIVTINPASADVLDRHEEHSPERVDALLHEAARRQSAWRSSTVEERAATIERLAAGMERDRERLARLASLEMGKPVVESRAEVDKCVRTCRYFAAQAAALLSDREVRTEARRSWVAYEPLGTTLAIMPWNYPYWQVVRHAVPALLAGNTVVLKHAPNTVGCAAALAQLVVEAGGPGLLVSVQVGAERVPQAVAELVADSRIAAVALTGSERAGAAVAALAGAAVKKTVLELGGRDALVVLDDADVERAAGAACASRFGNSGQSCVAAKRFVVHQRVLADFTAALLEAVGALRVGDPLDEATTVGPLARQDLRQVVDRQVRASVAAGATVLAGGAPADGPGFFYPPTVLTGVTPQMPVVREEVFGPVAVVVAVRDDEEAGAVAGDSDGALGLSIWTQDETRARRIAAAAPSGLVAVNAIAASDPRLPFGGTGRSGYGRELAAEGLHEFTTVRSWWLQ